MDKPFILALRIVLISVILGVLAGYAVSEMALGMNSLRLQRQARPAPYQAGFGL